MALNRPTSHDIAKAAGVSQSTVSLVLRGDIRGRVSSATQARVLEAANQLGYRPNEAARALKSGQSRFIGLMVPDVADPYFVQVLRGAQSAAQSFGYSVVLLEGSISDDWVSTAEGALSSRMVSGVVVCAPTFDKRVNRLFRLPVAFIDAGRLGTSMSVNLDVSDGMSQIARHLVSLGHRRFGRLRAAVESTTFLERHQSFMNSLPEDGVVFEVFADEYSIDGAAKATDELLRNRLAKVTAIVADSDLLAAGVYLGARARGLRIPFDLAVTGFDDIDLSRVLEPKLTTVRVSGQDAGTSAVKLLEKRFSNLPVETYSLPVDFVPRGSTLRAT